MHSEFGEQMLEKVLSSLPDGTCWHGQVYHFRNASAEDLLRWLSWMGVLDCSTPGVQYAIATLVVQHRLGLASSYLCLGYMEKVV